MDPFVQLIPFALQLPGFLLVLFRIGGIMIMAPFIGSGLIPAKVKIALAITLAAALWPVLPHKMMLPVSLPAIVFGVAGELLVGLAIGLAVTCIFTGLQLAGTMIGQQMGVSLADVFDPTFQNNADVLGVLYYWIGLMVFLAIGGHRLLVGGLVDSFSAVPPGGFAMHGELVGLLAGMLQAAFVMAFKIAIPAVMALFLTSIAMGLVARTVPQLNILSVGFAVRTSLGMLMAAATLVAGLAVFTGTIEHAMNTLNAAVSGWVK